MSRSADIGNEYLSGVSLTPQVITADTNGTGVDFQEGQEEVTLVALNTDIESEEDTTITYEMEESSDDSTYTDMTTDGSTAANATAIAAASSANHVVQTFWRRTKRYVRVVANVAGTSVSETVAAVVLCKKKSL